MPNTISPNMGLIIPTVGQEPGPDWASDINADLGTLDQHDHSTGQGVAITPAGMNINTNLSMNTNNLTAIATLNFTAFGSTLPGTAPNLGCVYVAGNELVYNDEAGNVVVITNNGVVNAGAGSIAGLPSGTASASYSAGTFVWESATNTPANMDAGSYIFRNIVASSNGVTVNPPNALASNYSLTLPTIPGATSVLGIDTSGNIGAVTTAVDSTGANAIADSRTRSVSASVGVGGVAISSSSGTFDTTSTSPVDVTNLTVDIVTSGRPVMLMLQDDGNGTNPGFIGNFSTTVASFEIFYLRNNVVISATSVQLTTSSGIEVPPSMYSYIDAVTAGTYTYKLQVQCDSNHAALQYLVLVAYEL